VTARLHVFLDIPAREFAAGAAFWAAATRCTLSAQRGEQGQFATLLPESGDPWVKLQAVEGQPRVHLDLDTTDQAGAVGRAVRLGATPAWTYHDVVVQRSPGGFLFCNTLAVGERRFGRNDVAILDQVCIDIPVEEWRRELSFWSALLERPLTGSLDTDCLRLADDGGPRVLLQRLDEVSGRVRAHPDIAVADRAGETLRHLALGAALVREFDGWNVLQAPYGQVYCLTDRDPVTGLAR
jgi:hypothetical protein